MGHAYPELNEKVVEEMLKKCGKYLIQFNAENIEFDYTLLVAKYCKNIQSINFWKTSLEGIEELPKNCKNIKELNIFYVKLGFASNESLESAIGNLISNNKNFRSLVLGQFHAYSDG